MQMTDFNMGQQFFPPFFFSVVVDIMRAIFHYVDSRETASTRIVAVRLIIKLQDALITGMARDVDAILRNWSIIGALEN